METLAIFRKIILHELTIRGWSRKELAQRAGLDPTLVNAMLRGDRRFNEDQILAIAPALECEPYQLLTPGDRFLDPESAASGAASTTGNQKVPGQFTVIHEIVPAAVPRFPRTRPEEIIGSQTLPNSSLTHLLHPFLMRMPGGSMSPTLQQGDLLLFHRAPDPLKKPSPNHIYLVDPSPGEENIPPLVRRVVFSAGDRCLTLIPDNHVHPAETIIMQPEAAPGAYLIAIAVRVSREL